MIGILKFSVSGLGHYRFLFTHIHNNCIFLTNFDYSKTNMVKIIIFHIQNAEGKAIFLFHIFIAFILLSFFPETCLADGKRIFENNKSSVVILFSYDKEGHQIDQATGFIVRNDGVVLTNYHSIIRAAEIKIKADGRLMGVKGLLYIDRENDMALLKMEGKNLPAVKIRDTGIGLEGQRIYLVGFSEGENKIILDGTLSRIKDITPERKLLLMTVQVTKGSSGSPVFNEDGEVIGIATFFMEDTAPLYFALPVAFIKGKLPLKNIIPIASAKLTTFENTAEYWSYIGAVYDNLGKYPDAYGAYQKAVEINPEDATTHNSLGNVYANLGIDSYAISEHNEAIRLKPDYQEAFFNLGRAYFRSDMMQEATESFQKAIRLKPDDAKSFNYLGMALLKSGKLKEAMEFFKQAIHLKPDYADAYYNLGMAHYQMNMNGDALQALTRAIQMNLDFPKAHFLLGVIYNKQNDTASALKEYEILKKLGQSDALILKKIIEVRGNFGTETPGSATAVPATSGEESLLSGTSSAPVKVPVASDKLHGPGNSGRHPQKDLYSVQVSVFNNKKNADSLTKRLKKKGYNVFLKKTDNAEQYRVLVGKFTDRDKAVKQARIILKKEKVKPVIFKH
jgi:tetratricopeptide (TPR) repeat protein